MDDSALWDVVVVGGGPAGMMAAGVAAKKGARVILIEKNATLGKKLLITGGGRCNVTNSEFDNRKLLLKFKSDGKFLFSAFSQWSVKETLDFFHASGMDTKVENELRTFPVSDSAQSVWDVLVAQLKKYKVTVCSNAAVTEIVREKGLIRGAMLSDKKIIRGRAIVIAVGGTSRPETGSTGDGYAWLKKIGHTIIMPKPSLVPIAMKDAWIKNLAGVKLDGVKITVFQNGEKQISTKGKILFTHVGVSGPTILNMSRDIGELLKYGDVTLSLDLFPTTDHGALDAKLQEFFKANDKKKISNAIAQFVQKSFAPVIMKLSGIDSDKPCNSITRVERQTLSHLLKAVPLQVHKLLGIEKAIITSGGVSLEEIDFKTMQSRLFPNLYLVGDILNIDRPSGGYSLQLCWTTGFVAGTAAAAATRDPGLSCERREIGFR
jgi:predicted Rossmann fold flavoprotein